MADDSLPELTLCAETGMPLPRVDALIADLIRRCGRAYVQVLLPAIASANHDDQARYRAGLSAAIDVLTGAGGNRSAVAPVVVDHVRQFLAAIRADIHSNSARD